MELVSTLLRLYLRQVGKICQFGENTWKEIGVILKCFRVFRSDKYMSGNFFIDAKCLTEKIRSIFQLTT